LRDLRPRTREAYLSYTVLIGRHYGADPAGLDEEQVRGFFLFLRNERHYAGSSIALTLAALRVFYCEHLQSGTGWKLWQELKVRRGKPLPTVLAREEVARLLASVRCDRFRTILRLIYHTGLRIREACRLQVRDLREQKGRIHVREGKGASSLSIPAIRSFRLKQNIMSSSRPRCLPTCVASGTGISTRSGSFPACSAIGRRARKPQSRGRRKRPRR
jgi:integrase